MTSRRQRIGSGSSSLSSTRNCGLRHRTTGLAGVRASLGRQLEAEQLDAQSLEMLRRLHGGDHPDVATGLHQLATRHFVRGSFARATELLAEALAMLQRVHRGDHHRHPMGPLRLTDLVGVDVHRSIADYLREGLDSPAFEAPALMRTMVAEGKLGKKSGQGFYTW